MDIDFVIAATGARPVGEFGPRELAGVSTDTRTLSPGELFVALKGPRFDGHEFAAQALAKGAAGVMVEREIGELKGLQLVVDDTLLALGELARAWRKRWGGKVVAITGSNGKSTTKEMAALVLGRRWKVLKNPGNYNNLIGLPLTLLRLRPSYDVAVVELGTNHPGEIARLGEIAGPDVAVVTNIAPAHAGPLGGIEGVAREKSSLYARLGPAGVGIINADDQRLRPLAETLGCRVVSFGLGKGADVLGRDISALGSRQAFTLEMPGHDPVRVRLACPGRHNVLNALAAAAVGHAMGLGPGQVLEGLEEFRPLPGRLNLVWCGEGGPLVVDDTYNANPASLQGALEALGVIASGRPRALVLGDMMELGEESQMWHEQAGRMAAESGCKVVVGVGEFAEAVAEGANRAGAKISLATGNHEQALKALGEVVGEGWVVLVKGSRAMAMERVVEGLRQMSWEER